MELKTKKGDSFFIDEEDYELVKNINWGKSVTGYIRGWCKKNKKVIYLHRFVMSALGSSKPMIDHINMIRFDNRKSNLRFCTPSENQKNKKSKVNGTSKYLGVSVHVSKIKRKNKIGDVVINQSKPCFLVKISINGKQKHIGTFKNEIDAAKAYNEMAEKYHGKFANLNEFK